MLLLREYTTRLGKEEERKKKEKPATTQETAIRSTYEKARAAAYS